MKFALLPRLVALVFAAVGISVSAASAALIGVSTYHNDNWRSGLNYYEKILTQANVASASFKRLYTISLDDQVDAQPLVATDVNINGHHHDEVVYVVTENNTVYALQGFNGKLLLKRNFGAPVTEDNLPGGCNNNAPDVGISSTPVIDPAAGRLYVITDTFANNTATYTLHALSLATLQDVVAPHAVTASGKLSNGQTYNFNANVSRLRSALLLSGGTVYAGFASYCDESADQSRGWLLGWNATTLKPLASNELTNTLASSTDNFFLSSIWMSGYGLAASSTGDVFFVTGNSDPSGNSFNATENLAETAVNMSGDLSHVNSAFTPTDWSELDQEDNDFGSGGIMLVPPHGGPKLGLAVAAGKDGNLYLLNRNGMKKYATYQIGGCWCGPSYYFAGQPQVITSGGTNLQIWNLVITDFNGLKAKLVLDYQSSVSVSDGQDPGFFTSISSANDNSGTSVIWAVSRPRSSSSAHVFLYAFDGTAKLLYKGKAGYWPNTGGNANIVPTIANGRVYVASNKVLAIFGLGEGPEAELPAAAAISARKPLAPGVHEIFGTIRSVDGAFITIATRTGQTLKIDATPAMRDYHYAAPKIGRALMARGVYETGGVLRAEYVFHAKPSPAIWMADR
jgi:hypothetical protein